MIKTKPMPASVRKELEQLAREIELANCSVVVQCLVCGTRSLAMSAHNSEHRRCTVCGETTNHCRVKS